MDVEATVRKVEQKIESCSQQDVELHVERVGTLTSVLNRQFLTDKHVNTESLLKHHMSPTRINKNTNECVFCLQAHAVLMHPDR